MVNSNNNYIIERTEEILNGYIKSWSALVADQPDLVSEFIDGIVETKTFLIETAYFLVNQEENPQLDEEFINRLYMPDLKPVIDYSILYEFDDLLEVYTNEFESSLDPEKLEALQNSRNYLHSIMDVWFNHQYGYSTEEFENDMRDNKFGVFSPLATGDNDGDLV